MIHLLHFCMLVPVTVLSALCKDTSHNYKFVCKGDSVKVFQRITSMNMSMSITLYKISESYYETIAEWSKQNVNYTDNIHDKYKHKVSLENETIFLRDFQLSDEAKYTVLYDDLSKRREVELCALVPPTGPCKPKIRQEGNYLIASLDNPEDCGNPLLSISWMEHPDISDITQYVISVKPGNETPPYHACIVGPALKCVKSLKQLNLCSSLRRRSEGELKPMIYVVHSNTSDNSVTLTCQTRGIILGLIRWRRNSILVTNNTKYSQMDRFLIIQHLDNDDLYDIYTCFEYGGRLVSDPYRIETSGPSALQIKPSITMVTEMDTLNISCLTHCRPLCSVTWRKTDSFSGRTTVLSENDILKITNLTRYMSGNYTCKVQNLITGTFIEGSLSLDILYGPDEVVLKTTENKTEVDKFRSTTIFCSANCFPLCLFTWTFSSSDTVIEGPILTLDNVTSNGSITCHAKNPLKMNSALSKSIDIMEQSENVRNKTLPANNEQDTNAEITETFPNITLQADKDQDKNSTFIDFPSIRDLLNVFTTIGSLGVIFAVVFCVRKKYIISSCKSRVSNNNMQNHSVVDDGNQDETLSQHYWTIVSNVEGESPTAGESDINVKFIQIVDPAANNTQNYHRSEEHEAYSTSFNSDLMQTESSCSNSVKSDGYINPIHSDFTNIDDTMNPTPSRPAERNEYIHPASSIDIELD